MSTINESNVADIIPAFNQVQVEYNATKVEKVQKLQEVMAAREKKYAVSGSN